MNRHLTHPATGSRYDIPLYVSRTGREFFAIGGASDDPPADPPADPPGGDDPPGDDWATAFEGQTLEQVQQALANSRKWETRSKDNFDKAQQLDALIKVINPEGVDTPPDPTKLAEDLAAAQQTTTSVQGENKSLRTENLVLKTAPTLGADPVRLVDSRSFMTTLDSLDPAADDFTTKVAEAIKQAVESNESFRAARQSGPQPNRQQGNPSEGKASGLSAGRDLYATRRNRTTADA